MEWTPQRLTDLATGYWAPGALMAAVEAGLFEALDETPRPAGEVVSKIATDIGLARTEALLDALAALELVEKTEQGYVVAASARALLSGASATCMLDALRYNADLFRQWSRMAELFALPRQQQAASEPEGLCRFVHAMESKAQAFTPALAPHVDVAGAAMLVEVGSGPGTLSRFLVARHPGLRATLVDLPAVLDLAAPFYTNGPDAARITAHPADYHTDALPGSFDVLLFAGALHQEPPAKAAALAGRFFDMLVPGGVVYVIDVMLNDDRKSPALAALFQLNMLLSRPDARVYSCGEVADLLHAAGFGSPERVEIPHSLYRIVKARKPGTR